MYFYSAAELSAHPSLQQGYLGTPGKGAGKTLGCFLAPQEAAASAQEVSPPSI